MMYPETISDLITGSLRGNRIEPVQRLVGGKFGWAIHRYPIKGGISLRDVLVKNITTSNALYRRLVGK